VAVSFRARVTLAALAALGVLDAILVATDAAPPSEPRIRHTVARQDPLVGMRFVGGERERNLARLGVEASRARALSGRMERMLRRIERRLDALLDGPAYACRVGALPARYDLLAVLVEHRPPARAAIVVGTTTSLRRQPWADASPIAGVYEALELGASRPQDATWMGVAAVLLGREREAIDRRGPWQAGAGWSRAALRREAPGIDARVEDYLAILHLLLERVNAEQGPCER
jgi:hypothetical protein